MTSDDTVGRRQGVLTEWNDDRGFGFIKPAAGGSRVFVHVSAFPRGRRPFTGCAVTYAELRDERHAIALIGGWPGALVARSVFRHKTTKQPFRTVFWFTVIANCVALAWFVHEAPLLLP